MVPARLVPLAGRTVAPEAELFDTPPPPSALAHLRASNGPGAVFSATALVLTGASLWLATHSWPGWVAGQLLFALALVQWFVLLHECGHRTLFRTRSLNTVVGHVAGFCSLIPFETWRRIHQRHHKWTGWQDLDPTTAALVPRPLGGGERWLVNTCWRWWIPLFSVLYRVNNFWNLPRVCRLLRAPRERARVVAESFITAGVWVVIVWVIGPAQLLGFVGVGVVLALVAEDLLLLSQHTHIPMHLSGGQAVDPYPSLEQQPFTRSMKLPLWMSWLTPALRCARAAPHVPVRAGIPPHGDSVRAGQ